MQTHSSYPLARPAVGLLDPTASLHPTPSAAHNFTCANPSTPNLRLPLRTSLPPLDFLLLADRLAELYEMVFSNHPEWLDEEVAHWQSEEDVATAVERFLKRMSALFPVHDEIWDVDPSADSGEAIEVVEWRLWEIPLIPMGFDEWYDGWDDLKEPSPYLLHMRHSRRDAGNSSVRDEFADLYPDHQVPRYLELHHLVETLRQMALPEPLDALPDLILMLDHNTDNAWLDVGELSLAEGGGYPPWSPDEVAWLTAEWQKAQPVLDRIHRLLDWQNGAPEEIAFKLTAVRDVLLDAYHRIQQPGETTTEVTP